MKTKKNRCATIQTAKLKVQRELKDFEKAEKRFNELRELERQKVNLDRMNNRIEEFWEKATGSVFPPAGKFTAGEYGHSIEEFAKLIANECAEIALKSAGVNNKSPLAVREAERICDKIKEHFGVK